MLNIYIFTQTNCCNELNIQICKIAYKAKAINSLFSTNNINVYPDVKIKR